MSYVIKTYLQQNKQKKLYMESKMGFFRSDYMQNSNYNQIRYFVHESVKLRSQLCYETFTLILFALPGKSTTVL